MKGKILTRQITDSSVGRRVIWKGFIWKIVEPDISDNSLRNVIDYVDLKRVEDEEPAWGINRKQLQELVIEYDDIQAGSIYPIIHKTLPLHPDDWLEALKHIGEKVEFYAQDFYMGELKEESLGLWTAKPHFTSVAKVAWTLPIPVVKETWDDIYNKWYNQSESRNDVDEFLFWLKQNYEIPKKK